MMSEEAFEHYKLGLETFDAEHWKLFSTLRSLYGTMSSTEVEDLVTSLAKEWESHSQVEERFMEDIQYPVLMYHKQEHRALTAMFDDLCDRVQKQKAVISESGWSPKANRFMLMGICDALRNHVDHADSQYKHYYFNVYLRDLDLDKPQNGDENGND